MAIEKDTQGSTSNSQVIDKWDLLFLVTMVAHILAAPYTKVEEIFQVNNIYDHIYLTNDVENYDFIEFPGVVYRTFISSLMIAAIDFPFKFLFARIGFTCYHMHVLSRITLGLLNFFALKKLRSAVQVKYRDNYITNSFFLIYAVQFHTMFYMSRPLPNTFALIFCNLAFASWISNKWHHAIVFLALATIVFRCDIIVLAFSMFIYDFLRQKLTMDILKKVIGYGVIFSIVFISITLAIDTFFWREYFNQRLRKTEDENFFMWPELYVLYYNTYLNKSHEWGTSPWYWYFLAAIPKSVTVAIPFILFGLIYQRRGYIIDLQILDVISPAVIFVGLYSILPHKELRFIFPALTLFNLGGAMGLAKIGRQLSKSVVFNRLLILASIGMMALSFSYSCISLYASHLNYPGGTALRYFNQDYQFEMKSNPALPKPYLHSDVYASMTGFNRFLYENEPIGWKYNRTENMPDSEYLAYTHLISDRNDYAGFKLYKEPVKGFLSLNVKDWIKNPLKNNLVVLSNQIYILEREDIQYLRIGSEQKVQNDNA